MDVKKFFLLPKIQISSSTIYKTSTLDNQEATKETDDADIDALIKDVNKFFLLAELQISSSMIYNTSPLQDGTSTDKDDGYETKILDIANIELNKVATSQSNWELKTTKLNWKLDSNKSKSNDKSNLTLKFNKPNCASDHCTPMLNCAMETNSITSNILSNLDLLHIQDYYFNLILSSSFDSSSTLDPSSYLFNLFHPLDSFGSSITCWFLWKYIFSTSSLDLLLQELTIGREIIKKTNTEIEDIENFGPTSRTDTLCQSLTAVIFPSHGICDHDQILALFSLLLHSVIILIPPTLFSSVIM